jgi:hypothetical protein
MIHWRERSKSKHDAKLQPVSCETVLRQSPTGPRHDSAAGYRQWSLCSFARYCLVCSGLTPFRSLCYNRHWIQVLRMCSCVDVGNIQLSWEFICFISIILIMYNHLIMKIIGIIPIEYVLQDCWNLLALRLYMTIIWAWPQTASSLCHPHSEYPGEISCCPSGWHRNNSTPPAFPGAPGDRRPGAGDGCRMWLSTHLSLSVVG